MTMRKIFNSARITMTLIVLSFAGAVWLITENNRLKARQIDLIDMIMDMQEENSKLQDYVIEIEEENVLLKSCCTLSSMDDEN